MTNLKEIGALFEQLLAEDIQSAEELERWILKRSELEAAIEQQGAILYIRMTCQTDDTVRVQSYKDFIETIVPAVKTFKDRLNKKYLRDLERFPLKERNEELFLAVVRNLRMVFDPEIPVNVYDLGLIYKLEIDEDSRVYVQMTLTAPNCPEAEFILVHAMELPVPPNFLGESTQQMLIADQMQQAILADAEAVQESLADVRIRTEVPLGTVRKGSHRRHLKSRGTIERY